MRYSFTAAAERAVAYASGWSSGAGREELAAEALLVGLLSESECRAALILAKLAVDVPAVCRQWPNLTLDTTTEGYVGVQKSFSADVESSLRLANDWLRDLPRPLELATEHLLLGLAADDNEVSVWLQRRGLQPAVVAAEIYAMHGLPLPAEAKGEGRRGKGEDESPLIAPTISVEPSAVTVAGCAERQSDTSLLRVLDAAGNRAREALRVVEDCVRFTLDDRHLTRLCKQLRHDLTATLAMVARDDRLAARETQRDVGTELATPAEGQRGDAAGVLHANFARLAEALRSIEEFGKLFDLGMAEAMKQLRYRAYTLERAVGLTRRSIERLATARLYVLVDGGSSAEEFERLVRSLVGARVDVIQLRDKRLADRGLLARARRLKAIISEQAAAGDDGTASEPRTLWIMNDRPDLAVLAGADGVHVGQEEMSVKDGRTIVGPKMLVGVSTHSIEQARQAVLDGADYIGVGPTFPSGTKQFEQFPGIELLRQVAGEIRLPAFAIGGIGLENVAQVLAAGFRRIAVSRSVTSGPDPAAAARELAEVVGRARSSDQ